MTEPLRRQSLAERVADQIENKIRDGHAWRKVLPGYRTLAEHFGTSSKTCVVAMEILEVRRVVKPAKQGQRRQVMSAESAASRSIQPSKIPAWRGGLLMISSSITPMTEEDRYAMRRYGDCWMGDRQGVNAAQVDYGRYKHPGPILKSLIETHQAGALLLHLAPHRWIRTAAALLPTYLMGGEMVHLVDNKCSGDSSVLRADVTQALSELRGLGHERVLIPVEPHLPGFRERIHGILEEAFNKSLNRGLIDDLCPIFGESIPAVWQDYWERAFSRTAPTAVILIKDAHVLSLYGYCTSKRIEIPSDLSVIYLGYSDLLGWCHPLPQMRFPLKRAIVHFREWVRGGLRPIGMKHFKLDKISGASVAQARRGNLVKGGKP